MQGSKQEQASRKFSGHEAKFHYLAAFRENGAAFLLLTN
jgi:hypothetical protein